MSFLYRFLIISIWFSHGYILSGQSEEPWDLIKEKENLVVYGRKLHDSKFKEIKVEGRIRSTLSELVLALEDVKAQEEWVMRTIEAKIIDHSETGSFHFYLSTDMPFPIKDRDLVVFYQRKQDPVTKIVKTISYATPDKVERKSGFLRIPRFDSQYTLTPKEDGWIEIEYVMGVDPGGALPAWLVNLAASLGPVSTMNSLYNIINSGRYKGLKAEGIVE